VIYVEDASYAHIEDGEGAIIFHSSDKPKLIKLFERALNTWSPPDPELIKLLEDMKK
jgi:hypothetical protein